MKKFKNNEDWFSSLTVADKSRIASKLSGHPVGYPECTEVWEKQTDATKSKVRQHCENIHGNIMQDWQEGKPYGD